MNLTAQTFTLPKNFFKITSIAVAVVFLIVAAVITISFQSRENVALEVNGQKISKDFFNKRIEIGRNFYTNVSSDSAKLKTLEKDELESIIETVLGEQELARYNQTVSDQEIEQELVARKSNFESGNPESYESFLMGRYWMSLDDQRYVIKRQLIKNKLTQLQVKKRFSAIWLNIPFPSDNPAALPREQQEANKGILTKAYEILSEVEAGANFGELVEKYSQDEISKSKKGDLGFYPYEELFPEPKPFPALAVLRTAYAELSNGEAGVFEYPTGYSVIKVVDSQGDWDYISYEDFLMKARKEAEIKIYVRVE